MHLILVLLSIKNRCLLRLPEEKEDFFLCGLKLYREVQRSLLSHLYSNWVTVLFLFDQEFTSPCQSVSQFSHSVLSHSLWPHGLQHTRPPCSSPTLGVYSNSCPSSRWCHPAISSSVIPFSSCPQSLPASEYFQTNKLFTSDSQSIEVPPSTSVLPMNTRDWSPLGWTGWISLQSKGLSRVFSNTTVQKHQFFSAQLSL